MQDSEKIKVIQNSELPQNAKTVGIMGAVLGASNDSIIHGMMAVMNADETKKAEDSSPLNDKPHDYDEIESIIHDMLVENTGTNMLDSGGIYGRRWQKNRQITDFRKNEALSMDIDFYKKDKSTSVSFSLDVFSYLTSFLECDDLSKRLQKELEDYANTDEQKDNGWYSVYQDFADNILKGYGYDVNHAFNTYNGDSLLSQVLQGLIFFVDHECYIILQIHNGADVRGGYTAPKIFKIGDYDYFSLAQNDINISCECTNMMSDDCGYHFYLNGCSSQDKEQNDNNGLMKYWNARKIKGIDKYQLKCTKCKGVVRAFGLLEY